MLRSPDLRLGDVQTEIVRADGPFEHVIDRPDRGVFIFPRRGNFILDITGSSRGPITIPQGTAVGFESGRAQCWRAIASPGHDGFELFVSSIPRQMGVLQRLDEQVIIVANDDEPFATTLRHSVDIHAAEHDHPAADSDAVIRRCAEICMIQFVRYARVRVAGQADVPVGLAHDEALLRAWSAYFAEPRRRWTLAALAGAAGLGRTVFVERFRAVFGAPPLQTLTSLRLHHAEAMLRESRAPLIEIAFTVGYNSEAAFVRAFHRQYGIPPGRFRAGQPKPAD